MRTQVLAFRRAVQALDERLPHDHGELRRPISRVCRETLTDISEKIPSADRNKTSAVTPASVGPADAPSGSVQSTP